MPVPILYSCNVFLKQHIQQLYRNDTHFVWCSERFDSTTAGTYSAAALVAPSSNPVDIYRDLKNACARSDWHNAKIAEQKVSLKALAVTWEQNGEISTNDRDDILYMVDNATFQYWRPLLYVIPYAPVAARLQTVPVSKRAGLGVEYVISDLQRPEFDLIEI